MKGLESKKHSATLDDFLDKDIENEVGNDSDQLSRSQAACLQTTLKNKKLTHEEARERNVIVETKNSQERSRELAFGACPCIRPSGRPFLMRRNRLLRGMEVARLQGIFEQDFRHMNKFSETMIRDLAGNSFSASVPIVGMLSLWATCPDVFEDPTQVTIHHVSG